MILEKSASTVRIRVRADNKEYLINYSKKRTLEQTVRLNYWCRQVAVVVEVVDIRQATVTAMNVRCISEAPTLWHWDEN